MHTQCRLKVTVYSNETAMIRFEIKGNMRLLTFYKELGNLVNSLALPEENDT